MHLFLSVVAGFENARLFGSTNTGLSQSDLSISSQGSANPSYRYGNQEEYDSGHLGYPMYGGSYESDVLSRKLELDEFGQSKWVEFDKSPDIEKTLLDDTRNLTGEEDEDRDVSIYFYFAYSDKEREGSNRNGMIQFASCSYRFRS